MLPARMLLLSLLLLCAGAAHATSMLQTPASWTQFRLQDSNNAAIDGRMSVAWRVHTGKPFSSSPALAHGLLFIGDNGGALYAIDPATGKTQWREQAHNPLMSAPLVYGNLVIVGEGDENSPPQSSPAHPIHVGAPPSALLAFDRATGALRWSVPLPGTAMPTPAIVDGILVQHNGAGSVYGIDPQTGRILYTRDLHSIASMTAALPLGNDEFATLGMDTNALWIMHARDGAVVSRTLFSRIASGIGDCPAVSDGTAIYCNYIMPPSSAVAVQTEREAIELAYAIDIKTGKRLWDVPIAHGVLPKRNEAAIPLLAYGRLYCGSSLAPYMHAIDPATGRLEWKTRVSAPVLGGAVAAGNVIYFGDRAGYLWALDARSGRVIGKIDEHTSFNVASPIIAGETLIDASRGGTIVAVPLATIRSGR